MNESLMTNRSTMWRGIVLVLTVAAATGCRSVRSPLDGLFGKGGQDDDIRRMTNIDGVRGPLQRLLSRNKDTTSLSPAAGRDEFEAAKRLFDEKKYKAAESAASKIASRYKNSPVREDALFLIAESQFQQKRYPSAQDSFDLLVKEFPSTRYLEQRNRRLFTIARTWLDDPSYVTSDNIKMTDFNADGARFEATSKNKPKRGFDISRTIPIFPNVWDRTRPVFDTEGRAIEALNSIWRHDPTGSLADDALMLTASHHMRNGNYLEADHIFSILRDEYPKSQHAENAHVLGSFVKQASYQGPKYDNRVLDSAKELKDRTLRLYPNTGERDRIQRDLRQIRLAKAAADWEMVVFYQRKGRKPAVRIYCEEILDKYPDTPYADKARDVLLKMGIRVSRPRRRATEPATPDRKRPRLFRTPKVASPADGPARVRL